MLHDWHAETVAIRAFNRFLLDECIGLVAGEKDSSRVLRCTKDPDVVASPKSQPFAFHDGLKIVMYCSEAPCGDASMELVMEAQEDATPWPSTVVSEGDTLLGRASFSALGAVRRKPGRSKRDICL